VGIDPIYVTWTSQGAASAARVMPALLSVDASGGDLLPGADNTLSITVRNPRQDRPFEVALEFSASTRLATKIAPQSAKITIPAGGSTSVPFTVTLGAADRPLALPCWWTVFPDINVDALKPAAF